MGNQSALFVGTLIIEYQVIATPGKCKKKSKFSAGVLERAPAVLALWCNWLTYSTVDAETAGSLPVGVA